MCGIYLTNIDFGEEKIRESLETVKFRGPDNTGITRVDELYFGHLRLSIIDLDSRSDQPMSFGNLTIVFNGEIYNYREIRDELIESGYTFSTNGDTEVILKGFSRWGHSLIPKLNGMFSFAIYDSSARKVFCCRDRIGVKPFYYYWKEGRFEICSQLRPLLSKGELSQEAISIFLDCTYIPSPYTVFRDIHKLPPGHNLEIDLEKRRLRKWKYWDLQDAEPLDIPYHEAKEQLHELLEDAVRIRLNTDVPFGTFLSGGIDSALITGIASDISDSPVRTFSIAFDNPEYDESRVASRYAEILGTDHTEIRCSSGDVMRLIPDMVRVYDEPFADSSALPTLLLNKVTREHVTMALSGDGGDECFLGYNHFDWLRKYLMIASVPYFVRNLLIRMIAVNIFGRRTSKIKRIMKINSTDEFIRDVFIGFDSIQAERNMDWFETYSGYRSLSGDPLQRLADLNIKLWLENDSNVKVDRGSMAYSVEVRSPFLDYRVIEMSRTLPVEYRYDSGLRKKISRDILKDYIPEKIFNQPKSGFSVPMGEWIRNELRDEFTETLSGRFLSSVPNLNIDKFTTMFRRHMDRRQDYSSYIWRLYVLAKWCREFGYLEN
ncbi:MAG: asparagine synthase (glutamine-hydrolyzing) [Candidatus Latescibacteria bacterium]|nr:asparagine synthase (glutamine-hydrolyzing) [bacterium]MBD3424287.1 asparagine synthase (glutamine-hydrolyzing) [Candidatus Latescibacterota bacterium]